MTLTAKLHLSLARTDIARARQFFNEAAAGGWYLNADQVALITDWAHDARKDAREHIRQARAVS